jgi:hypothetical protein
MYKFFKANAGSISYENYFNTNVKHRIFPVNAFPNASARYQQLWSTAPERAGRVATLGGRSRARALVAQPRRGVPAGLTTSG